MHDWLDQYEYSMSSADTVELVGGSPDLAAGINEDALVVQWADWRSEPGLWVHFRSLVSRVTFCQGWMLKYSWDVLLEIFIKIVIFDICLLHETVVVSCWILFVGVWHNSIWLGFQYGWWKSWSFFSHSQYRDRAESLDALFNKRICGSFRQSSEWFDISGEVRGINVFCLIVAW